MAFYGVHPGNLDKSRAVFYSNPYLAKPMPPWTKLITHAEYSDGRDKDRRRGTHTHILGRLRSYREPIRLTQNSRVQFDGDILAWFKGSCP